MAFWDETKTFDTAYGLHDHSFVYRVGEIVEPTEEFDRNLDSVCTSGIHYFLTKERAYYWNYLPKNGVNKIWYENGQIDEHYNLKDGLEDGLYEKWYSNGQMWMRCTMKKDCFNGLVEVWNRDGSVDNERTKVY